MRRDAAATPHHVASNWRPELASVVSSLLCASAALLAIASLGVAALEQPVQLVRFETVAWSGPPPDAGSAVAHAPDGRSYYLSRGPIVYLVESEAQRVRRAWIWRLEDAESLYERAAPRVSQTTIEVQDLYGDRVVLDRKSGQVLSIESKF